MNEIELKNLWQSKIERIEKKFSITQELILSITQTKVQGLIASMQPVKIFTVVAGILWVLLVDSILIAVWNDASVFFLVSAIIQVVTIKLAIGIYLYQLALINQVDITEPVLVSQQRLAKLKLSTLWCTRILMLQLPAWSTFYLTNKMFSPGNATLLLVQVSITVLFIWAAVWLFINIRYENRDKKWFRLLFSGKAWTPIMKSMELLNQMDDFEK